MLHGRTRTSSTRPARWVAFALTLAVTALLALAGASAASAQQSAPAFSTSFEPTQPPPTWSDTVEAGRSSNVDGTLASATIPGNVTDKVVEVQASGENPPNEIARRRPSTATSSTKWLTFTSTAWLQVKLSEPVKVVTYALTSANDSDGPRPAGLERCRAPTTARAGRRSTPGRGEDFAGALPDARVRHRQRHGVHATTASTSPRTAATTSCSSPSCSCPPAGRPPAAAGHARGRRPRPEQRPEHQARAPASPACGRCTTPAATTGDGRALLLRQGLRRRRPGRPRHAALLQDLPGAHRGRPAVPEHLRRGRPRVLRRHLPVRPRRARPARRDRQPAGPGRVEDALRRPVERQVRRRSATSRPARRSSGSSSATTTPAAPRTPSSAAGSTTSAIGDGTPPDPSHLSDWADTTPRHELERLLLARQQLPRDRRPARVQLLDAGDRRGLAELALRLPVAEQRGQPADAAGVHASATSRARGWATGRRSR